jgi:hypothetical protein
MQSPANEFPQIIKAEIHMKRNERQAENRKIERLRLKLKELQKRQLLARAS